MEPVSGHGFMPVTRYFIQTTAIGGTAGHDVSGIRVRAEMARQYDGPVIIVKLPREEVSASEAIIFRAVVAIMFMGRDRIPSESIVLRNIEWQSVVMPE